MVSYKEERSGKDYYSYQPNTYFVSHDRKFNN